jgi:hypothetical protein
MSSTETEKSEPERPGSVPGRARGKGRGRGKRPAPASASSRPSTQAKVEDHHGSDNEISTSSSDQSEESKRIAAAASSWEEHGKTGRRKAPSCPQEMVETC